MDDARALLIIVFVIELLLMGLGVGLYSEFSDLRAEMRDHKGRHGRAIR